MDDPTFNQWVIDEINQAIPTGEELWHPADVAEKLVIDLRHRDPDRFREWAVGVAAPAYIRDIINQRVRNDRLRRQSQARAEQFGEAARRYGGGETTALDPYLIQYTVNEAKGDRKALGDMTGTECARAAQPFARRAAENGMQAAFLHALAKRVGQDSKVRDVMSREQLRRQMVSIGMDVPGHE